MFGKHFGDGQDQSARADRDSLIRREALIRCQLLIELPQPRDRDAAFSPGKSTKDRLECCRQRQLPGDMAKPDNVSPLDSATISCARCSGAASSGIADARLNNRPCHSCALGGAGAAAIRCRSRKLKDKRRRVRSAGDRGGSRRNDTAPAAHPRTIAAAEL